MMMMMMIMTMIRLATLRLWSQWRPKQNLYITEPTAAAKSESVFPSLSLSLSLSLSVSLCMSYDYYY
jgi:hypothetical protein